MGWSKKKTDPISDRARALNEQIASLEAQIKSLDAKLGQRQQTGPRLRSTAVPQGSTVPAAASPPPSSPAPSEPIFEAVDQQRLQAAPDAVPPEHFNDLGMRK